MSKLSKDHIDQLFDFLKSKYVRYYDVQLELVDHLASAIEEEMTSDNNITFQQGLDKVYSRFPVTGFNNFIQEKTKGLQIFWSKKFFKFALEYFRLPKIILTIGITLLLLMLSQEVISIGPLKMNGLSMALIIIIITQIITLFRLPKVFRRSDNNNLLSIAAFKAILGIFFLVPYQIILQFVIMPQNLNWASNTSGFLVAIFLSVFGVAIIIITDGLRSQGMNWINEEIYNKYPEYFERQKASH